MYIIFFFSNWIQVVRLFKLIFFLDDVKYVEIIVVGRSRIIILVGEFWDSWFDGEGVSIDFMSIRE